MGDDRRGETTACWYLESDFWIFWECRKPFFTEADMSVSSGTPPAPPIIGQCLASDRNAEEALKAKPSIAEPEETLTIHVSEYWRIDCRYF
jgi:hypothetical protein